MSGCFAPHTQLIFANDQLRHRMRALCGSRKIQFPFLRSCQSKHNHLIRRRNKQFAAVCHTINRKLRMRRGILNV